MSDKHDDPSTIVPPISGATELHTFGYRQYQARQMHMILVLCALLPLAGCASYATGSATPTRAAASQPRDPAVILVTENDINDRRYDVVGDISVTVRKATIFNQDPTRGKVNEAMQREAAKLGADAVILARYGSVGIDPFSWGRLDGNGRAVRFAQ